MDIRKLFAEQIENAEEVTEERFEEIVATRVAAAESAGLEFDEQQVREVVQSEYPVGDKVVYALVSEVHIEREQAPVNKGSAFAQFEQGEVEVTRSMRMISIAETELELFAQDYKYVDTPESIPRFIPRRK